MPINKTSSRKNGGAKAVKLEAATHRRILHFLNEAIQPEDLMYEKVPLPNPDVDPIHEDNPEELKPKRKKFLAFEVAKEVIEFRDQEYPLGFRHLKEVLELKVFDRRRLDVLLHHFSNMFYGSWSVFLQSIPRRGPGGYDGVVHAALLHTGKVLFITADETTMLWNPDNTTTATFEDPINQPQQTPDVMSGS